MRSPFQNDAQQQRYAEWISAQVLRGQTAEEALQQEVDGGFLTEEQARAIRNGGYSVGALQAWDEHKKPRA